MASHIVSKYRSRFFRAELCGLTTGAQIMMHEKWHKFIDKWSLPYNLRPERSRSVMVEKWLFRWSSASRGIICRPLEAIWSTWGGKMRCQSLAGYHTHPFKSTNALKVHKRWAISNGKVNISIYTWVRSKNGYRSAPWALRDFKFGTEVGLGAPYQLLKFESDRIKITYQLGA